MMNNDTTVNEDSAVFHLCEMRGKLIKTIGSYDDYTCIMQLNLWKLLVSKLHVSNNASLHKQS